ncbi:diguanylate cyclase (GGDEF) domain-containing protein [Oribacterium sp. KHPX15]|uniref:GGDEF domain-containing protein n=1 Tax=Oribacterium sp. KHPX15 TaxID=1855342 RepID=UPI0008989D03|nr:GGDEF domain-containing protein [Oribacterium sp. KHPX15]SEA59393.1 diguanylate cyclase (GGDEF) domain-containing protein [Oribacterium sp. KHPX15]
MLMNKFKKSLSLQISVISILSYIILAIVTIVVVHMRFQDRMIKDYTRMGEGVTTLMAKVYDTDKTEEYIEKNFTMPEYNEIIKYFYDLKDNYPDIYYLYVYRFDSVDPPNATVIFDLDEEYTENPPQESIDWIGEIYTVDEPFASEIGTIMNGESVVHTVFTHDKEYLLSYVRPILDKDGNYVASACVDFSMEYMFKQDKRFIFQLAGILGLLMVIILTINILILRHKVTHPLDRMTSCIDSFVYETEASRFQNVQRLESLDFRQEDEIGVLYNSFVSNMKESLYYMSNFNKAKDEIVEKENEIEKISQKTYTDGLTPAKNKAAYLDDEIVYDIKIKNGLKDIATVMVDINNLKYVNDTFGHDVGDKYIMGCYDIIQDTYKNSPIYRMGGDEFLVVLTEEDFEVRDQLFEDINARYQQCYDNEKKEPYDRYSASVGMASYNDGDEFRDIIKRADKHMYERKMTFKNEHGSYR